MNKMQNNVFFTLINTRQNSAVENLQTGKCCHLKTTVCKIVHDHSNLANANNVCVCLCLVLSICVDLCLLY